MITLRIITILGIALLLSGQSADYNYTDTIDEAFEQTTLIISSSTHACYVFDTYLALTNEQRRRGLMFVRELPEFSGMLFAYRQSAFLSIWMKNTYIPLDLLFIHADGRIANIVRDAQPHTLDSRVAAERVNYVLEINGGVAAKLGIDNDSRVIFALVD